MSNHGLYFLTSIGGKPMRPNHHTVPDNITHFAAQLEQWRKTRANRRAPIPTSLRRDILALTGQHPTSHIVNSRLHPKRLGIDSTMDRFGSREGNTIFNFSLSPRIFCRSPRSNFTHHTLHRIKIRTRKRPNTQSPWAY